MKRYLSFILALLLLFIVAIYINRVSPDDNKINQQGKNGTVLRIKQPPVRQVPTVPQPKTQKTVT